MIGKIDKNILIRNIILTFSIFLLFIVFLYIWEQFIETNDIPKRILPKPSDIGEYFQKEFLTSHRSGYVSILEKALQSFVDALIGFSISIVIGTGIGIIIARYKLIKITISPSLFIIQLLPVPAFAPVIAAIFGYGVETKILIITLFTIFPIIINVNDAVRNIPKSYISLLKSYNAGRIKNFFTLTLPAIVPSLLITIKIGSTSSFVASIIAELPLTVSSGIGKDIYNSFNNQLIPRVWISLLVISIISLLFYGLITISNNFITTKFKYGYFEQQ